MSSIRITYNDNNNGSIVFGTESVANWQEIESNLTRSNSYRGRVRKVTNTFEFVGDVRNFYIMRNFAKDKTNAQATLLIEVGDDNFDEFSFTPLGTGYPMVADFNSYKVVENKVQLNFVDSEFQQKISSGEKEKLNITTPNVLGEDTAVTDYATLLKTISMHDREIEFKNSVKFDNSLLASSQTYIVLDEVKKVYCPIPVSIVYKSDDNYKNLPFLLTDTNSFDTGLKYYLDSEANRELNQSIDANFRFSRITSANCSYEVFKRIVTEDDVVIESTSIQSGTIPNHTGSVHDDWYASIDYQIDETIDVKEGYSLQFYIEFTLNSPGIVNPASLGGVFFDGAIEDDPDLNTFDITSDSQELFPRTTSNCILPHEFFTHWIEIMTGQKNAFYSKYFGRTDLGYDEDGEGAHIAIMDGYMVRNMPIEEKPLNATFKDMVEDFIKLKNLVAGIKYVGDIEVFSIEKYEDFYGLEVIADLGEIFNDVELEVNKDLTYSKILVGTKDLELEDLTGLDSPHGEVNYSTPLTNVDNELNLVLKAILNEYAIEQLRRKQYNISPEEDTKNDKNIILVDAKPWTTTDLMAKTDEGYTSITGVLSPNKMYNVNLVPSEQVRLWGNVINGCLQAAQDGELTLTKSASNNTLVREKDSGETIIEKSNIPVNELDTPRVINENIMLNSALSKAQYDLIEANPEGLYKFTYKGVDFYSYYDMVGYNVSEKNANFTLNRSSR